MISSVKPLTQQFVELFDISLAHSKQQLKEVFRIRSDVYCDEFGYEPKENCPGGLEQDKYDRHAVHCLITHKETGLSAGCVRSILVNDVVEGASLPLLDHCRDSLEDNALNPTRLRKFDIVEVSRLTVHPLFRRPKHSVNSAELANNDALSGVEIAGYRAFPLITTVLFLAATSLAQLTHRKHNLAMMEPRLARLLQRSGFHFQQIGNLIDYHGTRAAFHLSTDDAIQGIHKPLRELFGTVREQLDYDFRQLRRAQPHYLDNFLTPPTVFPQPSPQTVSSGFNPALLDDELTLVPAV